MGNRRLIIIVATIVVAVVVLWLVNRQINPRTKLYRSKLASAMTLVSSAPGYSSDPAYYRKLTEASHGAAFNAVFDWRGQRRQGGLWRSYAKILLRRMIKQAEGDNRPAVAQDIQDMLSGMMFPS